MKNENFIKRYLYAIFAAVTLLGLVFSTTFIITLYIKDPIIILVLSIGITILFWLCNFYESFL